MKNTINHTNLHSLPEWGLARDKILVKSIHQWNLCSDKKYIFLKRNQAPNKKI